MLTDEQVEAYCRTLLRGVHIAEMHIVQEHEVRFNEGALFGLSVAIQKLLVFEGLGSTPEYGELRAELLRIAYDESVKDGSYGHE